MPHSCRDRLEQALHRIADPAGEGARTCLTVYAEEARAAADAADVRARFGRQLGALDGRIVSIKDLFAVKGEPTRAGSRILADAPPATADAPVVARLRRAGAVIVARTNMTEFAFSGIGINPHYGTPRNPADRSRVPGGSSSGAAVSVADGFAEIGIGTDTGGSTRIPAAFCGIVGHKPSARRVPREGAFPLSYTLDSVGPLARSVRDCIIADAVMAGEEPAELPVVPLAGLRLGILQGMPLEAMQPEVESAFENAVAELARSGAAIADLRTPLLADMAVANATGGFSAAESFSIHRGWIDARKDEFDQRVRTRIDRGRTMPAADYVDLCRARARLVAEMDDVLLPFDAVLMPTTPIVAPVIAELEHDDEAFFRANVLALRNTSIGNFFDLCAISLPISTGSHPVGLMLVGRNGLDRRLFAVAQAIEAALAA
jgi:aspartyl-tRNA(Asn)/glutamyl-tRNA(Gln) amidotransferase subunit A